MDKKPDYREDTFDPFQQVNIIHWIMFAIFIPSVILVLIGVIRL